jgi:hypothetical protein
VGEGFMSGLNAAALEKYDGTSRDLSSISNEEQQQRLRLYCNEHPLAVYVSAVYDLYLKNLTR